MYLVDANTMINRVQVTKLGVRVAQITESFHRDSPLPPPSF